MDKAIILTEFRNTFSAWENAIQLFDATTLNQAPFEGSWTAAEVTQHLILANGGFATVLEGKTAATTRPVDQQIPVLKDIFLNFDTKMKSPEFIVPRKGPYAKEELLKEVRRIATEISAAAEKLDLSETCLDFELPSLGFLTRLEAIHFVMYHTQRHTHQMVEIHKSLHKDLRS